MSTSLESTLAEKAKSGPLLTSRLSDGALVRPPLELLDDNPWQPRTHFDERELEELVASIRSQGLIQPIAVRPKTDGRFIIVAGHRRVGAFRRLLESATSDAEKQRYTTIPATVKPALDDAQLAAQAYAENVARAALTPLEEAKAIENMIERGLARTPDEVATLLGQSAQRVKRLRRIATAPRVVKDALDGGLMVTTGQDAEGREKRELRRLDMMTGIAFIRMVEHLRKSQPKKAEERTEAAIRRALSSNWGQRRVEEYVDGIIHGRIEEASEAEDTPAPPLFSTSAKRFVVERSRFISATAEQRANLRAALSGLLAELDAEAPPAVAQR